MSRKRVPLNQNECTADFRIGVPFEQNFAGGLCNTVLFGKMLDKIAEEYVSDNNQQLAAHISYRLKSGEEFISDFGR